MMFGADLKSVCGMPSLVLSLLKSPQTLKKELVRILFLIRPVEEN